MFTDFCEVQNPKPSELLWVHNIYRVLADQTYCPNHTACEVGRKVFVFTNCGAGELICSEGTFLLSAKTALVFSADTPFSYHTVGDQWHFWWFEFSGKISWQTGFLCRVQEQGWIGELCENALDALRTEPSEAAALLAGVLTLLPRMKRKESDNSREIFVRARLLLMEQLNRTNVSSMAQELGVDPRTLYNLFQRYAGCSPKRYMQNYVMDTARYLLRNTVKSIGQISDELGFSNQFHFSRVFKASVGVSPREYRGQEERVNLTP